MSDTPLARELRLLNYPGIFDPDPVLVLVDLIDIFEEGHLDGAVIRRKGEEFTLHTLGQITAVLYTVLDEVKAHRSGLNGDE